MKKIFLALTATTALLVSVYTRTHAQMADAVATNKTNKKANDAFAVQNSTSFASSLDAKTSKMAARAFKDFSRSFKNIAAADWVVTAEGGFVASFKENEVKNSAYYDNKGRWLYSMKRYDESMLPQSIRHMVKSTYYDYNIVAVQEIEVTTGTIYLVHILGEHSAKTIRIADSDMDVIEDLTH